jgi:squalene cyclase
MTDWLEQLRYDPLLPLIFTDNKAVACFAKRDLFDDHDNLVAALWTLPAVNKLLKRQQADGSWRYRGGKPEVRSQQQYNQLETYRVVGELVEKYGLTRAHPALEKAAEFLFGCQTDEGDFRGMYGNQYTPNYSAAIMELLIKAGYGNDPRLEKGFQWLLAMRQQDGGWAIPLRTVGAKLDVTFTDYPTLTPDRSKPCSHLVTGIVLRAFAAHERYRRSEEARTAGKLMSSRFFMRDKYPDRAAPTFWTKFTFPFWFTDLLSALDSLSLLGFTTDEPKIKEALDWFVTSQGEDGLWNLQLLKARSDKDLRLWLGLAICRVFRRLYGQE